MKNQAPKHKWNDEQRTTLAVLDRFYTLSKNDQLKIFNHVYGETLSREGFSNGLTSGALTAQLVDLRTSPRGETFRSFLSLHPNQARTTSRQLRDKIEEAADDMNITLWLRPLLDHHHTGDRDSGMNPTLVKRRRLSYTSEPSLSSSEDSETSCSQGSYEPGPDTDESDLDRFEEDAFSLVNRVSPLLRTTRDMNNRKVQSRPRLLFRACRPEHQLRARRFLGTAASIPCPPALGSREFKNEVYPHLSEDQTYDSPFLSLTASLKRALTIIKKAESALQCLHLAILDYNVVEEYLENKRFGKADKIFLVPEICKEYNFDDLQKTNRGSSSGPAASRRKGYTGLDEFLIWGSVPCEPIGILDTTSIRKLVRAMKSVKELNYERGVYLSDYLRDVHVPYKGIVAYKLVRAFEVKDYHRGRRYGAFKDFLAGIYGDNDDDSESLISPQPALSDRSEGWSRWSQATTPPDTHHTLERASETVEFSRSTFSGYQRQSGLTVEIPSLRASLAREYARGASLAANDDIQELVDRQVAMETSQFGILVDSSRRSSPTNYHADQDQIKLEANHTEDLFLQQLTESAKDGTPPNTVSLKDLDTTAPNLTIDSSGKTPSASKNRSTTKGSGTSISSRILSKPQSSHIVDLKSEKSSSLRKARPKLRRQRTLKTSTTLMTFNEEQTTTVQEDESLADDEEDGIMIIGTSRRRQQTVLSIRSRSFSEAAVYTTTQGNAPAPVAPSRIPLSKKKAPIN